MFPALAALILTAPATLAETPVAAIDQPMPNAPFSLVEHRAPAKTSPKRPDRAALSRPAIVRRVDQRRARHLPLIRAAEAAYRLPPGLLDALIATESAYGQWSISRAGAAGLAQLMPATAAELGVSDRFDAWQSTNGGARYLRRMLDRFGSIALALAAYNAGPGAVRRAGGIPSNGETPDYVRRVLRHWTERTR